MNKSNIAAAALALAMTAIVVPGAAFAQRSPITVEGPPLDVPFEYVSYGDLNLASGSGLATLQRRVRRAASRLCLQHGAQPVHEQMQERTCYSGAIAGANQQIGDVVAAVQDGTQLAGARIAVRGVKLAR